VNKGEGLAIRRPRDSVKGNALGRLVGRQHIDAIIGLDVLGGHDFSIDYQSKRITFELPMGEANSTRTMEPQVLFESGPGFAVVRVSNSEPSPPLDGRYGDKRFGSVRAPSSRPATGRATGRSENENHDGRGRTMASA